MSNKFKIVLLAFLFAIKLNAQCNSQYGTVVISEIYFDTHYNENIRSKYHSFGEYIELFNSSTDQVNLEGWVIKDNHTSYVLTANDSQHNDMIIEPGGFKIITYNGFYATGSFGESEIGGRAKFLELFPGTNTNNPDKDIILQNRIVLFNEVDKVTISTPQGKIIDEVSYLNESTTRQDPLGYLHLQTQNYTKIINPKIDNNTTYLGSNPLYYNGCFNGPIGEISIYNPLPFPTGSWLEVYTTDFSKAIFRLNANNTGYYANGGESFDIATATPMDLPTNITIPLKPLDPLLYYIPIDDNSVNYKEVYSYDIKTGNVNGHSKTYFDAIGKSTVSLSEDFESGLIWGNETLYNENGRKSKESFPTITCLGFEQTNFLSNTVIKTNFLDKYYSNNNTLEPYQATAQSAFSEVNYDTLNPGNVINTVGGNKINGDWRTGYSYTVPAAQEMYYVFGMNFFDGPINNGKEEVITKFYKTVSVDANGVENVVFKDGEGKTLATARAGLSNSINPYPVYSLIGTQGFVDVHIPSGIASSEISLLGNASSYQIWDLKTGQIVTTPLVGGNAYRIVSLNPPSTVNPKTYIDTLSGNITIDSGAMGISYKVNYYDYAINVYDKTGRLNKSIQPNGFKAAYPANPDTLSITAVPSYLTSTSFSSSVSLNTLGQVIQSSSPDEGTSRYGYRQDGQIRYSQSAKQALSNQISYTNYDEYARPIESGVIQGSTTIWNDALADVDVDFMLSNVQSLPKSERTFTVYDYADNNTQLSIILPSSLNLNVLSPSYTQENLSGSVAITYSESSINSGIIGSITWYSYDIYGRSNWVVQYSEGLGTKTLDYVYDYKGNVNQVIYQKNIINQRFTHQYTYDSNNKVTKVETASENNPFVTEADYEYYKSGELKRTNIGQGLQGLDYVYTLGGALKSINDPSLNPTNDPGKDGLPTPTSGGVAPVAPDLFGITLDYFSGDYTRSGTNIKTSPNIVTDYNGNIRASRWANKTLDNTSNGVQSKSYQYNYNRDNWLTDATFGNSDVLGVISSSSPSPNMHFEGGLTYDANGNIKTLKRANKNGNNIDDITYQYNNGNNQLSSINDAIVNPPASAPLAFNPIQQGTINYTYNVIGQLTHDSEQNIDYSYNAQGLVTQVSKLGNPIVKFFYNERGQRIKKEAFMTTYPFSLQTTDYYSLDLAGNTMCIYTQPNGGIISPKELPIYGLSRLGICYKAFGGNSEVRNYQITDHLGNVRAVIQKASGSAIVAMISYADYYPFGEQLEGRNSSSNYRYAYEGQELDPETGKEAFQLRLWDGRIGRWLSPDPKRQYSSPYLGMGNNPIGMVDADGGSADWHRNIYGDVVADKGDTAESLAKFLDISIDDARAEFNHNHLRYESVLNNNEVLKIYGFYKLFGAMNTSTGSFDFAMMSTGYNYNQGIFDFNSNYRMFNGSASGYLNKTNLGASVAVSGGEASISSRLGTDDFNVKGSANGKAFSADASADIGIYTGQEGKKGIMLMATAGATALRGDVSSEITIFGVHFGYSSGISAGDTEAGLGFAAYHDENTHRFNIKAFGRGGVILGGRLAINISF